MEDWLSYRLQDFLLFDKSVYLRQFERYNEWLGLYRFSGIVAGLWLLFSIFRKSPSRIMLSALLICSGWVICSYAFLWQFFRPINWTIDYVILLPVLQIILLVTAVLRGRFDKPGNTSTRARDGITLIVLAFLMTLVPWLSGQAFDFWPAVLLTPESLALASIGHILNTRAPIWYSTPSIAWLIYNGLINFSLGLTTWFFSLFVIVFLALIMASGWRSSISGRP